MKFPVALASLLVLAVSAAPAASVDFSGYREDSAVRVKQEGVRLQIRWPMPEGRFGAMTIDLSERAPLVESVGVAASSTSDPKKILGAANPIVLLTVGSRNLADPAGWVAFFDNAPLRPHETHAVRFAKGGAKVTSEGNRVIVRVADAEAASFAGHYQFTFYAGSPLVRAEAVMRTKEDGRAILYDAGFTSERPDWNVTAWLDNRDAFHEEPVDRQPAATPLKVRYRAVVAQGPGGSLAVFPAPHQYFYPLDECENFGFTWRGVGFRKLVPGYGFGIRQPLEGDKRWVPWFNAPPGTDQRLAMFFTVSEGNAKAAIDGVKRYTNGDSYRPLPGRLTFTSHYHIEHALEFVRRQREQKTDGIPRGLENPAFVRTFKDRGVNIVHLGEFHVGETPSLGLEDRLRNLRALHEECARLSDHELLLLPGEEPNVHLGGHWVSFFPRPVYWVLNREGSAPFSEERPGFGPVYRVGSAEDMLALMERENGLMWTAHARIKGSREFPDKYRHEPFFRSPHFLGAAWKAMPADLSRDTLGWRVLDLEGDFANWGERKYILGEVDVFRFDPDYESYAAMNINYLELDQLPRFRDGWKPVLDALRGGRFFVSTGEVLIPKVRIGGKNSGETLRLGERDQIEVEADVEWTFPLAFAEVVSGDGKKVYRERVPLVDTAEFGRRTLKIPVALRGRTWVRLEVWDVAANGAFTQPVWIEK